MPTPTIKEVTEGILSQWTDDEKSFPVVDYSKECKLLLKPEKDTFLTLHDNLQQKIVSLREQYCQTIVVGETSYRVYKYQKGAVPICPPLEEPLVAAIQYLQGALAVLEHSTRLLPNKKQELIVAYNSLVDSLWQSKENYKEQIRLVKTFKNKTLPGILNVKKIAIGVARDYTSHLTPDVNVCTIVTDETKKTIEVKLTRPIKQSPPVIREKLISPLGNAQNIPIWLSDDAVGKGTASWLRPFLLKNKARIIACGSSPPPSLRSSPLAANAKEEAFLTGTYEKTTVTAKTTQEWQRYGTPSTYLIPNNTPDGKKARRLLARKIIQEDYEARVKACAENHIAKYGKLYTAGDAEKKPIEVTLSFLRLLSPLSIPTGLLPEGYTEDDNMEFLLEEEDAIRAQQQHVKPITVKNTENKSFDIKPVIKHTNNPINSSAFLAKTRKRDIEDSNDIMRSVAYLLERLNEKHTPPDDALATQIAKLTAYFKEGNWSFFSTVASAPPDCNLILEKLQRGDFVALLNMTTQHELALKIKAALFLKKTNHLSLLGLLRQNIDHYTDFLGILKFPFQILNLAIDFVDRAIIGALTGSLLVSPKEAWSKFRDYFWSPEQPKLKKAVAEAICSDNSSNACKSARDRTSIFATLLYAINKSGSFDKSPKNLFNDMQNEFADGHFIHCLGDKMTNTIKLSMVGKKYKKFVSKETQQNMKALETLSTNRPSNKLSNLTFMKINWKQVLKASAKFIALGVFMGACIFTGGLFAAGSLSIASGVSALMALSGASSFSIGSAFTTAIICIFGADLLKKVSQQIVTVSEFMKRHLWVKHTFIALGVIAFIAASVFTGGILPAVLGGAGIATAATTFFAGLTTTAAIWAIPLSAFLMGIVTSTRSYFKYKDEQRKEENLIKSLFGKKEEPDMPAAPPATLSRSSTASSVLSLSGNEPEQAAAMLAAGPAPEAASSITAPQNTTPEAKTQASITLPPNTPSPHI